MFGKLKEKLKSWFKKTEEKATDKVKEAQEQEEKLEKTIKETEKKAIATEKPKKGLFKKIKEKLKFKLTEDYFEGIFSDLELIMLENNVALQVVEKIKQDLKKELVDTEIKKDDVAEKVREALKISIESLFVEKIDLLERIKKKEGTFVIVFFGINGSGKTTTIAKTASLLLKNNISCVLSASDTFRAASIEQLEKHAENLKLKVIKSKYGSDPASVAFDAIKHAESRKIKAVLIDTAGRMHTKQDLMKEMEKICRVSKPDLRIFVAESITGNDATEQARAFNEKVGIDAIILTKADVDSRGGTIISVSYVTGKPILFLGTGQNYNDLEVFDKTKVLKQIGIE